MASLCTPCWLALHHVIDCSQDFRIRFSMWICLADWQIEWHYMVDKTNGKWDNAVPWNGIAILFKYLISILWNSTQTQTHIFIQRQTHIIFYKSTRDWRKWQIKQYKYIIPIGSLIRFVGSWRGSYGETLCLVNDNNDVWRMIINLHKQNASESNLGERLW